MKIGQNEITSFIAGLSTVLLLLTLIFMQSGQAVSRELRNQQVADTVKMNGQFIMKKKL